LIDDVHHPSISRARSFARLRKQQTHSLFAGYLHLQQQASALGRLQDLKPDFLSFFKLFFRVGNAPLGAPYIKPFTEQQASTKNLWLNENVAGSYAPSSLRAGQPFRQVVEIAGRAYSLPIDHAARAFKHLLYSSRIPVAELAVFLYRDFGLTQDDPPSIWHVIDVFSFEFGYSQRPGGPPNMDFSTLYSLDSAQEWEGEWVEWHG
jgi:hypothetical protein